MGRLGWRAVWREHTEALKMQVWLDGVVSNVAGKGAGKGVRGRPGRSCKSGWTWTLRTGI